MRAALRAVSRRVLIEWAMVAAVSTLLVVGLIGFSLTTRADNLIHDVAARLASRPADPQILIVAIDDASLAQLGAWPWPRERHAALLERLARAQPKAVLYDVLFTEPAADPAQDAALARAMGATRVYLPVLADPATVPPIRALAQRAAGTGAVDVQLDEDGLVRRAAFATVETAPLAYVLYRDLAGSQARAAPTASPLIHFADPQRGYPTASFASVLRGEVPASFLKDRIVLVGATAGGLGERFPTPLSGGAANMPGVELQANVLDNLLGDRLIRTSPKAAVLAACLAPLWLLLGSFLLAPPRWTLAIGAGLAVCLLGASLAAYGLGRLWLPPAAGVAGLLLVLPLWGWRRLAVTSDRLGLELARLKARLAGGEGADLASGQGGGDVIARQMEDISLAIEQVDDLRRFAADALFSLPDATLVLDPDRRVLAANGAARALFANAVRGEAVTTLIASLSPRRALDAAWPPQDAAPPVELTVADGRIFEVQSVWRRDETGAPAGWIVRLADVSLLKSALRHREQALQLLTHDMRSPQTSILALLQSAPEKMVADELGGRIAAYARRTLALADGFVRLARAEDAAPRLEAVDLSDVLMEAADELWPQSRQRGMTIQQAGLEAPLMVLGDREILTRVFVNLLSNAVKYGPVGSVVRLGAARVEDTVEVEVADEGPGFTAEERAALFGAFAAFERPQAQTDGVGLGLAFVRTAVTRHGGRVFLRDGSESGAVFVVSLPAA
ncbi:CHASE2 domain-containing protein [Caulobacter sp. NIBR2454]|uniref:CHASE2 domain-containing protein n=1 Tax=Caulobacter sp. NIBR2454 TaxID=3015996 RepID=UPI0022B71F12|nr:CHASE2 domain-containing protein [Caulobacter sp. NIBR2454]